jgi:hypothetical protein
LSWLLKTSISALEDFEISWLMPLAYMSARILKVFRKSTNGWVLVDFESKGDPDGG